MENKQHCCNKPSKGNKCHKKSDIKQLAFIMMVFGLVSVCAFFLPIKAWIVLLGGILIYCGYKLHKSCK